MDRPAEGRALHPVVSIALTLMLLLGGCSNDWIEARQIAERANVPPPPTYRAEIVAFMHTYLNNPTGVRDAYVSEPALRTLERESTSSYVACLRYNARKSDGQYAGSKDSLVLFRNGRLDRVVDNARGQCNDVAYQPFHELETMSR